uniref:Uncharacterized protein n=1 Tax=Rhizophora mucronata TaxID=61149 RepID=A0A2P2NJX0_RHIMU
MDARGNLGLKKKITWVFNTQVDENRHESIFVLWIL